MNVYWNSVCIGELRDSVKLVFDPEEFGHRIVIPKFSKNTLIFRIRNVRIFRFSRKPKGQLVRKRIKNFLAKVR